MTFKKNWILRYRCTEHLCVSFYDEIDGVAQRQGAPLSVGAISVYLGGEGEEYEAHVSEGASARGTSITFPLTREDREAIDFTCGYIASNLGGDLSCSRLANRLYMGKTKLKNLFKTATGLSPSHYVAHERMEEAARLLAETDLAQHDSSTFAPEQRPEELCFRR